MFLLAINDSCSSLLESLWYVGIFGLKIAVLRLASGWPSFWIYLRHF